jgi:hypothetical protein
MNLDSPRHAIAIKYEFPILKYVRWLTHVKNSLLSGHTEINNTTLSHCDCQTSPIIQFTKTT